MVEWPKLNAMPCIGDTSLNFERDDGLHRFEWSSQADFDKWHPVWVAFANRHGANPDQVIWDGIGEGGAVHVWGFNAHGFQYAWACDDGGPYTGDTVMIWSLTDDGGLGSYVGTLTFE